MYEPLNSLLMSRIIAMKVLKNSLRQKICGVEHKFAKHWECFKVRQRGRCVAVSAIELL